MERSSLLLHGVLGVKSLLGFSLDLLSALLLVVLALHVLELAGQALDLVLVFVYLSLVHVEFGCHGLHLSSLFLEVLLIDGELLCNFGARLSREQVLELDVELLLLLDDDIFLNHLLSLLDEALLESLDLLEHFPSVRVGAFELPPPMVVQWVLELLREGLDLEPLGEKLLL